jgi:hypothetical protein
MMDSNRSEILAQLASGQISADQAAEQLRGPAVAEGQPVPAAPQSPPMPPLTPEQTAQLANHWLRIRVSDLETGRQRVAVNLPLTLVSIGLRIGAKYAPEVAGLDTNELLAMLQSGFNGPVVDVEDLDGGEHVQIYIE